VLNESEDRILEVSRTGRMVMRRGQHTSRVLDAMRVAGEETNGEAEDELPVEIAAEEQV
jgi:acetolactate synthase-1/3 small subunit